MSPPPLFVLSLLLTISAIAASSTQKITNADCVMAMTGSVDYFESPGFPAPLNQGLFCGIRIRVKKSSIRQIRFDFINFNIAPPADIFGDCTTDKMAISNGESSELSLCGSYSDRHVYYNVDDNDNDVLLNILLGKDVVFYRTWLIRITLLEHSKQAPPGCLQYYTDGVVGIVNKVDFKLIGTGIVNQNRRFCIQEFEGTCNIFYSPCNGSFYNIGGFLTGPAITLPLLTVVPFKRDKQQEIIEDNFQDLCITYQQDPCQFPTYKPYTVVYN